MHAVHKELNPSLCVRSLGNNMSGHSLEHFVQILLSISLASSAYAVSSVSCSCWTAASAELPAASPSALMHFVWVCASQLLLFESQQVQTNWHCAARCYSERGSVNLRGYMVIHTSASKC